MNVILLSFFLVLIIFLAVIESVRRGILETKYSLIWIITCVTLGILSSNSIFINTLANWLNVFYAPSLLFLFGLLFAIIMIFDLTRRISKMNKQLVAITQEHALLKKKYEDREYGK
ncbi:DUF2304 domain-containing protein [Jeotgalibacillus aurantiacus]|uniref:DUF2304 domain-containing protein n=1 Tax=Jeotgalibacillus aurantiacus TaxID=2763266 RepID=UPI001D0A1F7A|nr:DUF2304 domain-containing protein [Jeotgalibacillus aurantiacus]